MAIIGLPFQKLSVLLHWAPSCLLRPDHNHNSRWLQDRPIRFLHCSWDASEPNYHCRLRSQSTHGRFQTICEVELLEQVGLCYCHQLQPPLYRLHHRQCHLRRNKWGTPSCLLVNSSVTKDGSYCEEIEVSHQVCQNTYWLYQPRDWDRTTRPSQQTASPSRHRRRDCFWQQRQI